MASYATFRFAIAAAIAGAALGGQAHAAAYNTVDTQASHLKFGYSQMNVPLEGELKSLNVPVFSFDPAAPETAKVVIEVPLSGVDSGNDEANAELKKPEWLNISATPVAQFQSSAVTATGQNTFTVTGALTIKGKTKEVQIPFTVAPQGDKAAFEGSFTFPRADFGIGEGPWGDFSIVANDIRVTFHVVAAQ